MSLLPRLISLAPDCPAAQSVIDSVTTQSRPKEVLLALSEALAHIEEELVRGHGLSDDEDEYEDEHSEEDLLEQIILIVEAHAKRELQMI